MPVISHNNCSFEQENRPLGCNFGVSQLVSAFTGYYTFPTLSTPHSAMKYFKRTFLFGVKCNVIGPEQIHIADDYLSIFENSKP